MRPSSKSRLQDFVKPVECRYQCLSRVVSHLGLKKGLNGFMELHVGQSDAIVFPGLGTKRKALSILQQQLTCAVGLRHIFSIWGQGGNRSVPAGKFA